MATSETKLLLGKREHQPGAISFRYSEIFDRKKLMKPPLVFGHIWNDTAIGILGNNKCGCCVFSTMAHLVQAMQRGLGNPESKFTEDNVISDYSQVTGYVPGQPKTDNGTYMRDAASYWRQNGVIDGDGVRHKITAYVDIKLDPEQLIQACHDLGGIALGLKLPQSAVDQFKQGRAWTVPYKKELAGGHAVALLGRNRDGNAIIATWDGITAATPEFLREFADEAVAFVSLEYLDERGINPRGYDRTELERMIAAL
jgi:hypothetical protein